MNVHDKHVPTKVIVNIVMHVLFISEREATFRGFKTARSWSVGVDQITFSHNLLRRCLEIPVRARQLTICGDEDKDKDKTR